MFLTNINITNPLMQTTNPISYTIPSFVFFYHNKFLTISIFSTYFPKEVEKWIQLLY